MSAAAPTTTVGPGTLNPANLLTLSRIGATPLFLWLLVRHPVGWGTWFVWFCLCVTDTLDGRMARRIGATRSGAFLDPLADKVLVLGAMGTLVAIGRLWIVPVALIAGREIGMSAYRSVIGRRGISVPANRAAKLKTWTQCVAAGLTMFPPSADHPIVVGAVLWGAVALTLGTGVHYALAARQRGRVAPEVAVGAR